MNNLELQIAEAVEARSKALHMGDDSMARAYRQILMNLWVQLPDHTPRTEIEIIYGGKTYILQSKQGGNAVYKTPETHNVYEYEYVPTDRRVRILTELHMLNTALYEIAELKAKGEDPVDETGETEIA